jgi:NADPH2:quinone reductase
MTKAIRIHKTGGPEVLSWEDVTVGAPGKGEVLIRQAACGLNYMDIYVRTGLSPVPQMPSGIGAEGAGVVEVVGEGVSHVKAGDRVAYGGGPLGAYSESRVMPAAGLVKLPDGIDDKQAASMMLKGMTARYLLRVTYVVKPGDTILFHAAAGGVGLIACQWAKHLGATVIGGVSSDEDAKLVKARGCDYTIIYSRENFVKRVREITGGEGVPVVYDSVGKDTFPASLDCLRPRGLFVSFGNTSGHIGEMNPMILAQKGSLFMTRPTLGHHTGTRAELEEAANDLFDVVEKGHVTLEIHQTYALKNAAQAHRDMEGRKTTGQTVLIP